ncbi:DNA-directed DNA polymerase [Formosa agariphila KMM 3901]|uniref:DNA-directed DNA polymerase n=1 Tax=Formosa agariphila (strain DSM 15362 / KCTC 12365 / LMG 23005 / KMM 3901 / M-2Alg 35-1) TaxID=1347342 RepID=T2KNL5_FORAG|nr:Y-family DNA polymerase [Formosa agariphila]CDF80310.1 DNA-directed DNA polymerase [Formosa agariphila KMM 3901]
MFALVDCNNFYASCERVFNPALNGKPIAVLSNNDGCVIARSNEAKALGIPMGAPAFEYKHLFLKHNIHVFSSNYALYGDMSSRVMSLLANFSPDIEIYSIDEAFLKFEGFQYFNLQEIGEIMRKQVIRGTGIPISIGFAPTKALTKVANKIAKKFTERTQGVYIIDTEEKRVKALKWTAIEDVWGVGRKHAKRLRALNINNAYQFTLQSDDWVRKHMSVIGLRLKHDLEGKPTLNLETPNTKKSIATTRSFEGMITDYAALQERVATFAVSCAEKLRHQNSHTNAVMVFLHTNGFRKDLPQYYRNVVIKTENPTNSSFDLIKTAHKALESIYKKGLHYKKAGVIVMNLTPEDQKQFSLFSHENPKHQPLMAIVDRLNASYGNNKVKFGSQSLGRQWKMKQERLSPRYSTHINDIIRVKV